MPDMIYKEMNDDLLLERIKNDDEKALDLLFKKYYPGLLRYCKMQLPYPSDEAEDIILEVFFKIWQQRHTLAIHSSLASYLYIVVKNRIHDFYRKKNISIHESLDSIAEESAPEHMIPHEQMVFKEVSLEMDRLIAKLPPGTQLVFSMNRQDNLTYDNIALILNVSINTVKTHMYRALKYLKEAYRASNSPC
jgi:RNA polymerase sigma-70 factor (ECF subfamily)